MLEEHRLDMRMQLEQADQLGPAVAPKPDNPGADLHRVINYSPA
jgi:hypothetical protein